jgi:diacylglycerol kinase
MKMSERKGVMSNKITILLIFLSIILFVFYSKIVAIIFLATHLLWLLIEELLNKLVEENEYERKRQSLRKKIG